MSYKSLRISSLKSSVYNSLKTKSDAAGVSVPKYSTRILTNHVGAPADIKLKRFGSKQGSSTIKITSCDTELKKGLTNVALQKGYFSLSEFLRAELKELYENTEERFKIPVPE